jgi:predicted metalloenzyme YecM
MIKNLESFFIQLESEIKRVGLSIEPEWFVDHICFRASSDEEYKNLINEYAKDHELLIESPIGGRLISTFKLKEPISFLDFKIPLIEIPMPKEGRVTPSGYEHIEIVIKDSFDEFQKKYSNVKFLTHALSKEINPELEIELDQCAIKFHHQSLEEVIQYEKGLL